MRVYTVNDHSTQDTLFINYYKIPVYMLSVRTYLCLCVVDIDVMSSQVYCGVWKDKLSTILDILTPDDIRVLVETVDEYHRRGNFQRIFPSSQSHKYLTFCEQPRYYNLLLDVWVRQYPGSNPRGMLIHLSPEYSVFVAVVLLLFYVYTFQLVFYI